MTIAAVLTVAISLGLVGASLLLKQGAANAAVKWQRGTHLQVWMKADASKAEINAVGSQLRNLPIVHDCSYWNQAKDYAEARKVMTPAEFSVIRLQDVPSSYRCLPTQPQDAQIVVNRFTGQPGVQRVTAPVQQIHAMQQTITILQWVFLIVAGVLLLSAAVLILNTIRLAIFARRREVSVMKLVGATNWFIRIPFMAEGMVQGLVGSGLAAASVFGLHLVLNALSDPNNPGAILTQMRLTNWQVFWTDLILVVVGIGIGVLGSLTAIRRFLDV
jgi:cell division transport system permease protein